jgi:hypothetical protein
MTRVGKIARFPHAVREQLNCRLRNGEKGRLLLKWLNTLPEARTVLAAEFGSQPVSEPNLSQWRKGGYREWLLAQESLSEVRLLMEEAGELEKLGSGEFTQRLTLWLSVRCAIEARKQRQAGADPDLAAFGRLCRGLTALRRGEHSARRLELEETRLELSQGAGSKKLEKLFWEWTMRPDIKQKLFPKRLTSEERDEQFRMIFGWVPDAASPGEQNTGSQREKKAAEAQRPEPDSDRSRAGVQSQEVSTRENGTDTAETSAVAEKLRRDQTSRLAGA